jgi:hypothetical protein
MRVTLAKPPTHDLHVLAAQVSPSPHAAGTFAAGPGVLLVLVLIAAVVTGALVRALEAFWVLMRSMFAMVAGLAVVLTAVIVLADLILTDNTAPSEQPPTPTPTTVQPTHAVPDKSVAGQLQRPH